VPSKRFGSGNCALEVAYQTLKRNAAKLSPPVIATRPRFRHRLAIAIPVVRYQALWNRTRNSPKQSITMTHPVIRLWTSRRRLSPTPSTTSAKAGSCRLWSAPPTPPPDSPTATPRWRRRISGPSQKGA
jgi:hypothetical protein